MASNLTGLSVWEFLKLKAGALLTLNSGGAKEVVYTTDDATGATAISIDGEVVQRRSATGHKFLCESTLGTEKVTNGNCETFTSGLVTGWNKFGTGTLVASEETGDVYAGSKSQKLEKPSGPWGAIQTNYMSVTAYKTYYVSFALKVTAGVLDVRFRRGDSAVTFHDFGSLAPAEWTKYEAIVQLTSTDSSAVVAFSSSEGTATTSLIDSVTVREVTAGSVALGDDLTVGGVIRAAESIATESSVTGKAGVTAGASGATRGQVRATRGAGTTTPGVIIYEARDGTAFYEWRTVDGRKRISTALPTADTDGSDSIDIEGSLTTGGAATIGGAVDAVGNITTDGNVAAGGNLSGVDATLSGNASVGGNATVTGNVITSGDVTAATGDMSAVGASFTGALYVGGAATIGGNVVSDGNVSGQGGSVVAGSYGLEQGVFTANPGSGGNKPGVCLYYTQAGQPVYTFAGLGGFLRRHSAPPASLTDGQQVGSQIIEGVFQVGEEDTTAGISTVHGNGDGVGGVRVYVSPNGTKYYFWVTDAGVLRRHTAMPTNWDSDGVAV